MSQTSKRITKKGGILRDAESPPLHVGILNISA
ncbi:hypothetical protein SMB34_08510 [Thalassospira permensis NBRC 106175]|uniref:Dihydropteroate synthase n=1 Tax=Thalassospira permensis NBRC 106175 TaxID=1353532 RepID=A0ABR4TJ19_9PROT|nr:hypothetical protein SMB34_08510 [Thalassospira permensis NBRC 106175]